MVDVKDSLSLSSKMAELGEFLGEENIKKFSEFSSSKNEGVYFVVACYFDVVEGVDMWHHDVDCHDGPRYFLYLSLCLSRNFVLFLLCIYWISFVHYIR